MVGGKVFQIALMGIARTVVGFLISIWYVFDDMAVAFISFLESVPVIGEIIAYIAQLIW